MKTYLEQQDKAAKFIPKKDDVVIVHINNRHFFARVEETRDGIQTLKVSILESGHTCRVLIANIIELSDQKLKEWAEKPVLRGALTDGIHPTELVMKNFLEFSKLGLKQNLIVYVALHVIFLSLITPVWIMFFLYNIYILGRVNL